MKSAKASHILVQTEQECLDLMQKIQAGANFAEMAKQYSQCPSRQNGGMLGTFQPKQMVPEFDKVVFSGEINKVLGPVKTQFGYHLIWIHARSE